MKESDWRWQYTISWIDWIYRLPEVRFVPELSDAHGSNFLLPCWFARSYYFLKICTHQAMPGVTHCGQPLKQASYIYVLPANSDSSLIILTGWKRNYYDACSKPMFLKSLAGFIQSTKLFQCKTGHCSDCACRIVHPEIPANTGSFFTLIGALDTISIQPDPFKPSSWCFWIGRLDHDQALLLQLYDLIIIRQDSLITKNKHNTSIHCTYNFCSAIVLRSCSSMFCNSQ